MHWNGGWGRSPICRVQRRAGKAEIEWRCLLWDCWARLWGQSFPSYDAYLLHGCPELALEVVHLHLDAHSCREQERGGARPDEYLGKEETMRAEKDRIHLKRGSLSVAVAVGRQAWAGGLMEP